MAETRRWTRNRPVRQGPARAPRCGRRPKRRPVRRRRRRRGASNWNWKAPAPARRPPSNCSNWPNNSNRMSFSSLKPSKTPIKKPIKPNKTQLKPSKTNSLVNLHYFGVILSKKRFASRIIIYFSISISFMVNLIKSHVISLILLHGSMVV